MAECPDSQTLQPAASGRTDPDGQPENLVVYLNTPVSVGEYDENWLVRWELKVEECKEKLDNRLVYRYKGIFPEDCLENKKYKRVAALYETVREGVLLRIDLIRRIEQTFRDPDFASLSLLNSRLADHIYEFKVTFDELEALLEDEGGAPTMEVAEFQASLRMITEKFARDAQQELDSLNLVLQRLNTNIKDPSEGVIFVLKDVQHDVKGVCDDVASSDAESVVEKQDVEAVEKKEHAASKDGKGVESDTAVSEVVKATEKLDICDRDADKNKGKELIKDVKKDHEGTTDVKVVHKKK